MSEIPTPVSESTAIEIVRLEGSTKSTKAVDTFVAGNVAYFLNNSGLTKVIANIRAKSIPGVVLYDAVSGERVVTLQGKVRVFWDGNGTVNRGTPLQTSSNRSGWVEATGTIVSGDVFDIGYSENALAAANSGLLIVMNTKMV